MFKLILGECLEKMKVIPDGSVDMVLCDLPYGTTACKWDTVIPFVPLWEAYKRMCKGVIVLTASQPFTSALVMSNAKEFRYSWIWHKTQGSGSFLAEKQPLRDHEDILVFSKNSPKYFPQMVQPLHTKKHVKSKSKSNIYGGEQSTKDGYKTTLNVGGVYPRTVLAVDNGFYMGNQFMPSSNLKLHPTQKPVALMEYLIRTYTNEGDTVLDNTMGSGTTGVACVNTNRHFIGIEQDATYFAIAQKRIREAELNTL